MEKKTFSLEDFDASSGVDLELMGGMKVSLGFFTLRSRLWVAREFGSVEKWEAICFPQDESTLKEDEWVEAVLKTIHHLIIPEHKEKFKSWEDLMDHIPCSIEAMTGLCKTLVFCLKRSEPLLEKLDEYLKKNHLLPKTK